MGSEMCIRDRDNIDHVASGFIGQTYEEKYTFTKRAYELCRELPNTCWPNDEHKKNTLSSIQQKMVSLSNAFSPIEYSVRQKIE